MESCRREVCTRDLSQEEAESVVCSQAEDYSAGCRDVSVCEEWRGQISCPPSLCPPVSHYQECGPGCERTCDSVSCQEGERPGCYCDPGLVMEGGQCRPERECLTCTVGNTTWPNTHTWTEDSCTNCSCQGTRIICQTQP